MYVRIVPTLLAVWLAAQSTAAAQDGLPEGGCETPTPVRIGRMWSRHNIEERQLVLTTCDGSPNRAALDPLSILARPRGVDRPSDETLAEVRAAHPDGRMVAPGIPRLHPGLLTRLQAIADRFPGHPIEIISGYRPHARRTSRHRHARALDIRLRGVSRAHVSEFARTLPDTGVGYYPNSLFTHVDVRARSAYWVDRSGPGQPADYGPPRTPARHVEDQRREIVAKALTELDEAHRGADRTRAATARDTGPRPAPARADTGEADRAVATGDGTAVSDDGIDWSPPDPWHPEEPCEPEEPPLSPEEVAALRQELLDAVRSLAE